MMTWHVLVFKHPRCYTLARMWVPLIFVPLQTFLFGSLDFVADQLGVLCLHEEVLVPVPTRGGAPSIECNGPLDDLNVETPTLRLEPMLGTNPTVSDLHIVLYSLFNTFRQLFGGTLLSPSQPPCDLFPHDFMSPMDACVRVLRRMLTPPPLMSDFMGMVGYALASFHDLVDDEVESDGSSIGDVMAPGHPLS